MAEFLNHPAVMVIKSIIDIGAVAYLIYYLYTLFEETNSFTIMKGFLFVIAITIIANLLGLSTLSWIFQYLFSSLIVLLVVLFQPEIRKMLSQVGAAGLFISRQKISREAVEEIANAAQMMSEERIGALIIIERNVGLKDLVENATQLDAVVKAELLVSIFFKNNILHDGGVVISGNKIAAARVIVPSLLVNISAKTKRQIGTRHRAGIAITAETDAVSVIVSEETGHISIGHGGKIEYDLSDEKFERRLNEILGIK